MARRQDKSSYARIAYPPGCKELSEELGKEELLKRLKVDNKYCCYILSAIPICVNLELRIIIRC